jgi:hypothetical protein
MIEKAQKAFRYYEMGKTKSSERKFSEELAC